MKRLFIIIRDELRNICHDGGAVLIFIGALVAYSALYGLIYRPEVAENVPVAVVDMDNTAASRKLVRMLDATSVARVEYTPASLAAAKSLFMDRRIWGVLYIPEGYEKNSLSMTQTHVSLYADGSYFMLYSSFMSSVSEVVMAAGAEIQMQTLTSAGIPVEQAKAISHPVSYKVENLFNPSGGYATSLLPAVLVVILQQVLIVGIGLLFGKYNEFGMWATYHDSSALTLMLGKGLAYIIFFIPLIFYLFWFDYRIFGYPTREITWQLVLFLAPYVLSVVFLAITLGGLFRKRESSILYIAALSLFFLMLSGVTWAKEAMPVWLYGLGHVLPSTSGIDGIIRMRTTGASLADVSAEFITLWALTFIYGITAVLSLARARIRSSRLLPHADTEPAGLAVADEAEDRQ